MRLFLVSMLLTGGLNIGLAWSQQPGALAAREQPFDLQLQEDVPPKPVAVSLSSDARKLLIVQACENLIAMQEDDGAWPYEGVYRVNRRIPVGYRIGGTAIVCTALLYAEFPNRAAADEAIRKGTRMILAELDHPLMKPSTDNEYDVRIWGHLFALDWFCRLKKAAKFEDLTEISNPWIQKLVDIVAEEEIADGGWNYANHQQPAAFVTAPAIQALLLADAQGANVPKALFDRGAKTLLDARNDAGAFQYSGKTGTRRPEAIQGSIARSALCEATLLMLEQGDATRVKSSIDAFHDHWDELEKRRKKTGTHEPPFSIAPYYFYFGHRYAAQAIRLLPVEKQEAEFARFEAVLMATMDEDKTWNDRVFDRSKAFGTAMSVLALLREQDPLPESRSN